MRAYVYLPIVPLPPTLKRPKRLKGAEHVHIFGVTFRITITCEGSCGISFEVIWNCLVEGGELMS